MFLPFGYLTEACLGGGGEIQQQSSSLCGVRIYIWPYNTCGISGKGNELRDKK